MSLLFFLHIGMDDQYSEISYLMLYFRLRIGYQSFIEKSIKEQREKIRLKIALK
jgi:hypothetical protein